MTDQEKNEVEKPFTFEERYQLRQLLKATEGMTAEEFATVKVVAGSGKGFVVGLNAVGRIILWVGGAFGAVSAYKALFGKGHGP